MHERKEDGGDAGVGPGAVGRPQRGKAVHHGAEYHYLECDKEKERNIIFVTAADVKMEIPVLV